MILSEFVIELFIFLVSLTFVITAALTHDVRLMILTGTGIVLSSIGMFLEKRNRGW